MFQKYHLNHKIINFIIFSLIIIGVYVCFIAGYGSDEDTLPMIYVFEARIADGRFVSSRFTGYPIPELGIGFLSYYFGSWAANLSTFIFYLIGVFIFYLSLNKNIDKKNLGFFLLLCLSSPVLYFENLEPMDYSWAFLFFSLGVYFLSKKYFEIAVLMFGFSIGCRINFLIFCLVSIYFYTYDFKLQKFKRLGLAFSTFIIGGLFYLPIWFHYSFSLDWLTAARPLEQGFSGLFLRFVYKTWLAIGFIQLLIILFYLIKEKIILRKENNLLILLFFSNLVLFFYIPAELSYLQPGLIFIYLLIIKNFNYRIISVIIFLNFLSWIINFDIVDVKYRNLNKCEARQAISANINFSIKSGAIENFIETRGNIACWVNPETIKGQRILEGKSIKIQ